MPKKLLSPEALRELLTRRFANQQPAWLAGAGFWPLDIGLGVPLEKDVTEDAAGVRAWVAAWAGSPLAPRLQWQERQFGRMGAHRFPASVGFAGPAEVAAAIGQAKRWQTASERYRRLVECWPALAAGSALASRFSVLADYSAVDFERLFAMLRWLAANPASGLYLRQIPVEGLDTKWLEARKELVGSLLRAIRGGGVVLAEVGFFELCGLTRPAHRVRIRLLCPELRRCVGGLRDIEAPVAELAAMPIAPRFVLIVENQESGLALPDIDGAVAILKLGNAVSALQALPWLHRASRTIYWGDIDTHGFAILDRARRVLPELRSVMMDEATLLAHRSLWVQESTQCPDGELALLSADERAVYLALRADVWGERVRFEQERLPWALAMAALAEVVRPQA